MTKMEFIKQMINLVDLSVKQTGEKQRFAAESIYNLYDQHIYELGLTVNSMRDNSSHQIEEDMMMRNNAVDYAIKTRAGMETTGEKLVELAQEIEKYLRGETIAKP